MSGLTLRCYSGCGFISLAVHRRRSNISVCRGCRSLKKIMKALEKWIEPVSQNILYKAEFQMHKKKLSAGWAEFADDEKILEDKGFPELQDEAREQFHS